MIPSLSYKPAKGLYVEGRGYVVVIMSDASTVKLTDLTSNYEINANLNGYKF